MADSSEPRPEFVLDGGRFWSLEGFFEELGRVLGPRFEGQSLDAFNDKLRGGFGTPEGGFTLVWRNADLSRKWLGHPAKARFLEAMLRATPPWDHSPEELAELAAAQRGEGPTLFDLLVEIIRRHGPGGEEAGDNVVLVLQ